MGRVKRLGQVAPGLKVVARRWRLYRRHFGAVAGSVLALRDRPGATGMMDVAYRDYPPLRVRCGDTDLRTLCHVLCEAGYEFPFSLPGDVSWIIDAGANIGMASVYFARRYPSATIVAIEPDRSNFELLERNTSAFANVRCVPAALWSTEGEVDLADPGEGSWGFRVGGQPSTDCPLTTVNSVTIDGLIERFGMDRISLLKVNIAGGERAVFTNPDGWIERVDAIAIELHEHLAPGCLEAFDRATSEFSFRDVRGEDTFVAR